MAKPVVYIAGPYTRPDPCINTNRAMHWWDKLYSTGLITPIVPHWSHFQHTLIPRPYEDWINFDLELIDRVDALFRLDGESSGADVEVRRILELDRPLFRENQYELLLEWARDFTGKSTIKA